MTIQIDLSVHGSIWRFVCVMGKEMHKMKLEELILWGKNKTDLPWALSILLGMGKLALRNLHRQRPPARNTDLAMRKWEAERRLPNRVMLQVCKPCLGILPITALTFGQALGPPTNPRSFPCLQVTIKSICLCRALWFILTQRSSTGLEVPLRTQGVAAWNLCVRPFPSDQVSLS